jgi:hypothetical protein
MIDCYYVLKYGKKYYAPYSNYTTIYTNFESILSDERALAVRFDKLDVAEIVKSQEIKRSEYMFGKDFDPSKVKIVKVNIKRHTIQ